MKKVMFLSVVSLMLFSLSVSAKGNVSPEVKTEVLDQSNVLKGIVFDKLSLISYREQTVEIDTNNLKMLQVKLEQR